MAAEQRTCSGRFLCCRQYRLRRRRVAMVLALLSANCFAQKRFSGNVKERLQRPVGVNDIDICRADE